MTVGWRTAFYPYLIIGIPSPLGARNLLDFQTQTLTGSDGGTHASAGDSRLLNWGRTFL